MWPRKEPSTAEYLRIGRLALERWQIADGRLFMIAEHRLRADVALEPHHLVEGIDALYASPPASAVTVLLESAWLPLILLDSGSALLRTAQLETLARHRFGMYFSDGTDPVSKWELRVEGRAGDRYALAYGLSPRVKQAIVSVGATLGVQWAAVTPAFAWGRDQITRSTPHAHGVQWWLWCEQDRTLVARLESHQAVGLNPGGNFVVDEADALTLASSEHIRLGVDSATDPIRAFSWATKLPPAGGRVSWFDVCGRAPSTSPLTKQKVAA